MSELQDEDEWYMPVFVNAKSLGIKSPEDPALDSDLWIFCFILLQKNLEVPQAEALWVVEGKRFSFQLAQ